MRQDDVDTLADIDNQNLSTKTFSIELGDFTNEAKTAFVFKGEDSVLLQNFLMAFPTEFKQMGKRILAAMYELSESGTSTIDRLTGFFNKYFWNKAQLYFPKSAYNVDAEYSYEEAWPPYNNKDYNPDVHPLSQSRGDHYEAERDWFINRLIYVSSKFSYGPFAQYNDSALGVISFRTQLTQDFTLTPAIDLYPTIHSGQSAVLVSTERVKAGESVTLKGAGGSNTNVYIKGADLLSDIGDLSTLAVDAANASIAVASKRLQKIKIGDEVAENVTSNLASINIGECPSLMLVDARNLASLSGTIDLTQCPRLREAYFGGTDVRAISLANGSKLTKLQLPNALTQISMQNLKFLEGTGLDKGDLSNVEFYRVENCPHLDAFGMLKELYNLESKSLRNIRVIGFVYDGDATDVDMVMNLAKDIAADGSTVDYTGIDSEGTPQSGLIPIIEGTLNIAGSVYADSAEFVREQYPNLVLNVTGGYYIRFADKAVQDICVANWGDGIGITEAQAVAVTSIGTKFKGNTSITSFNELEKFTGVTKLGDNDNSAGYGAFTGCSSLKELTLPRNCEVIRVEALAKCTALERVNGFEKIKTIKNRACYDSLLSQDLRLDNVEGEIPYQAFSNTSIKSVYLGDKVTSLQHTNSSGSGVFANCKQLYSVRIPASLNIIGGCAFYQCTALKEIIGDLSGVTTIYDRVFYNCTSLEIADLSLPNLETLASYAFVGVKITKISNLGKITAINPSNANAENLGDKSVLKEVTLPNTIKTIGNYTLFNYTALDTFICQATTPPTLGSYVFNNTPIASKTGTIYVPDASVDAYKAASEWATYADIIKPLSEYVE